MTTFLELSSSKKLKNLAKALCFNQSKYSPNKHLNTIRCLDLGISLDYSHQNINDEIFDCLMDLAHERQLSQAIQALMSGEKMNKSENLPALHTALRSLDQAPIILDGCDIIPDVLNARETMGEIAARVRSGKWRGYTNKKIQHIVNIGIGGSDLGPRFCIQAFKQFAMKTLQYHFISDADPNAFQNCVSHLNPETTLFIIVSKSFTTPETLYNAKKAMSWIKHKQFHERHFIAVTANPKKAKAFDIHHVIEIWSWVGGRFSLCSAVNLITAIAIGFDQFSRFLAGANKMDSHFKQEPFNKNLPVLLGLFGIWNNNFLHIHNLLLLTYLQQLEHFVSYVQQLDMESNGKSTDHQGRSLNYATGPIVWGGLGNRAQHSYYQLLCQGTHKVAAELITVETFTKDLINELFVHNKKTLTYGNQNVSNPIHYIAGGIPLNHIHLKNCAPETIGALTALYEHKIFVQSVIWNINPFDQPGVESAKKIHQPNFSRKLTQSIS